MYGRVWTLIIAVFAVFAAPLNANAEPATCAARAKVLQHLSGTYKEAPVAMGLANNGGVIEVMRSPDNATFTIIITMPDGQSCMIEAGQSWESLPRRLAGGPGI
jgi:hypothetical protein